MLQKVASAKENYIACISYDKYEKDTHLFPMLNLQIKNTHPDHSCFVFYIKFYTINLCQESSFRNLIKIVCPLLQVT